jgi:hypothetical protein
MFDKEMAMTIDIYVGEVTGQWRNFCAVIRNSIVVLFY